MGAGLLVMVLLRASILTAVAEGLIVQDSLRPAAAIVVLGGGVPFREMEAAELYHAGWAPTLLLVRGWDSPEVETLRALGIEVPGARATSRAVLEKLGVPPSAILLPQERARGGTFEELQVAARVLGSDTLPVILVTSKAHTRRVRVTWEDVTRERLPGIVRAARSDPFDASGWWRERRYVLAVVREYMGLVNHLTGYPVRSRAEEAGE